MMIIKPFLWTFAGVWLIMSPFLTMHAQSFTPNYDESKVPAFTLADPLISQDGSPVSDAQTWRKLRRPELMAQFAQQVYGKLPGSNPPLMLLEKSREEALDGKAVRHQYRVQVSRNGHTLAWDILLYTPASAKGPVPIFLGLNFNGNQTIHADPGIKLTRSWVPNKPDLGITQHQTTEASRGQAASRWQVELLLDRGYGIATAYCGDMDPDIDDGFQNGVHPLFYEQGQQRPRDDEWGSIGAWAWGLSQTREFLAAHAAVQADAIAVIGHSRLGKTALWAGAVDTTFALVISNNSGCGGAALSKRAFGETVGRINSRFPHWFCKNFHAYNENEAQLPLDQHQLLSLIAPRPLYVASASEDQWADPRGEYLATYHALPVYRLLGVEIEPWENMPAPGEGIMQPVAYHFRPGQHDITAYDWTRYLDFADRYMKP